ncbi:unnamed protein product [Brachionus calyciflorus]|uniref:BEN domain-containing protein n=1 Tax=Brachionus calyciflorus TaxID=104777 RepID=A0A813UNI0_9BILA|nr:unnamed protein product [Brachionus calyciflorus]
MFAPLISQIHTLVPDIGSKPPKNNHEFFGYLIISQFETIQSVTQLEKKHDSVYEKTDCLEKTVVTLQEKCNYLEDTIIQLKNLIMDFKKPPTPQPDPQLVPISKSVSKVKQDLITQEFTKQEIKEDTMDMDEKSVKSEICLCCSVLKTEPKFIPNENMLGKKCLVREDEKEIQRLFNKRVKYEVNKKFGSNYLAEHQVRELDVKEMYRIKRKVLKLFSPFPLSVKTAWNNAMNSLRQDRHQLKKRTKCF